MRELLEYGNYQFYIETDRDIRAYELAIQILVSGQTLDDPEAIRPIIERYLKSPDIGKLERKSKHAQLHEQLMKKLGFPIR